MPYPQGSYRRDVKRLIGVGLGAGAVAGAWTVVRNRHRRRSIDEQVRSGLRNPVAGWWVELVLREFSFLVDDYGYTLDEVYLHFKGYSVSFRGSTFRFVTGYDPEAAHFISAELWLVAALPGGGAEFNTLPSDGRGFHPTVIDVNRLLQARDRSFPIPETMPARLDRAHVTAAVATWARGLRKLAPDVLAGQWPEVVEYSHPW